MLNKLRKTRAGFTLVELIVVIAILAILAGVAIPVYSGYIKKANEAADNTLLDALNTAFASACLENRINVRKISGATFAVDDNNCVTGIQNVTGLGAAQIASRAGDRGFAMLGARSAQLSASTLISMINASFVRYYGTNASVPFKVFHSFIFDRETGTFKGSAVQVEITNDGTTTTYAVTFSNGNEVEFHANNTAVEEVMGSTFGADMSMGELTNEIGGVVNAAVNALGGQTPKRSDYDSEEAYQAALAQNEAHKVSQLTSFIGGAEGLASLGLDPNGTYTSEQLGNALVVKVASGTGDQTRAAILNALNENNVGALLTGGDISDMLPNIACMYGLMTGYANSEYGRSSMVTVNGQTMSVQQFFTEATEDLMNATSGSDGFTKIGLIANTVMGSSGVNGYLGATFDEEGNFEGYSMTSQAMTDLSGYISAMSVIAENKDALISGAGVLDAGFANEDLLAVLNSIFG